MEEFIKMLEDSLSEEMSDVAKYEKLANWADEHELYGVETILLDISKEEKTHAKHIKEIIRDLKDE